MDAPMADIQVKKLDQKLVVTFRHIGPYETVNETWAMLSEYVRENKLGGASTQAIGIVYDDPTQTPSDRLRYDACLTIDMATFATLRAAATDDQFAVFDPSAPVDYFGKS